MTTETTQAAAATAPATETPGTTTATTPATDTATAAAAASLATATDPKATETPKTEPAAAAAVPEKYELALPKDSKLGPEYLTKVAELAKAKGWSQERAQIAVDERLAGRSEIETQQSEALQNAYDKVWPEQLKADPEFKGKSFEECDAIAAKAMEKFLSKEELARVTEAKLNRNPILFKFAYRAAALMEPDKIVNPNNLTTQGKVPPEQRWFPEHFKTKES